MHSLSVHQRIWRRSFEKDSQNTTDKRGGYSGESSPEPSAYGDSPSSQDIPIDQLYAAAKKRWDQLGVAPPVTKGELLEKIRPEYQKKMENLKKDEKVSWTLNKKTNQVEIKIEQK